MVNNNNAKKIETTNATKYCLKKVLFMVTWKEYSKALKIAFTPFVDKNIERKNTNDSKPARGFTAISAIMG